MVVFQHMLMLDANFMIRKIIIIMMEIYKYIFVYKILKVFAFMKIHFLRLLVSLTVVPKELTRQITGKSNDFAKP